MLGSYDFCGYYEWTFQWLETEGGEELLHRYWREAIAFDSQTHAHDLIVNQGIEGMKRYWGHTLAEESPEQGYYFESDDKNFRFDMHQCPSKGFLKRNDLEQYRDYCDHCIGWIRPIMDEAGFVTEHEHNHQGQCWWQFYRKGEVKTDLAVRHDIRSTPEWKQGELDRFPKRDNP